MNWRIVIGVVFPFMYGAALNAQSYTSYMTGDAANVDSIPTYAVVMAGGAGDHDNAMKWMLERANGGDVLVLRASGSDGYNDYFYSDLGVDVNSVETIVCNNASSGSDPYILQRIAEAECIFFAGGDQYDYIDYWMNSPAEIALNDFIHVKRGVMGGTSAGMAILGGHVFTAENGTITSSNALNNPFSLSMTLIHDDFLTHPYLLDVITDTHYDDPDRRGRHVAFMAQMSYTGVTQPLGIACNEYVAVAIDENGMAYCFGEYPQYDEYVYFLRQGCTSLGGPETIEPFESLTWDHNQQALKVYRANARLDGSSTFDLNNWVDNNGDGQWQDWSVVSGSINFNENTSAPDCFITRIHEPISTFEIARVFATESELVLRSANDGQWIVTDVMGRQVAQWYVLQGENRVGIPNWAAGVYVVQFIDKKGNRQMGQRVWVD
ncbi:MAG: hypothetical protein RLZZ262_1587 [Bacteroidota bacterium]